MKRARQEVTNFYEKVPKPQDKNEYNPNFELHHIDLPFRMLLVGASGSMKTNTVLDVIEKMNGSFDQITVVCRNKNEPLYKLLEDSLESDQITMVEIEGDDLSSIPKLSGQDSKSPHKLVVFDDLCLVKDQTPIDEFFIRARKLNISCMYLTQSYFCAPKIIRSNCNIVILKKIDNMRDLRLLLSEYSMAIELDQLVRLYSKCTREKLDFLMVITQNEPDNRFFHCYEPVDENGDPRSVDKLELTVKKIEPSDNKPTRDSESDDDVKDMREMDQSTVDRLFSMTRNKSD